MKTALPAADLLNHPAAVKLPSPDNLGGWMEWSDDDASDLILVLIPGDRYYFLCELLSGSHRYATDAEIEQYYAHI